MKEFVACKRISMRAGGYGLEEFSIDGNDVEETRGIATELIDRIRQGEGPFLVEAVTYRLRGHYVGDPEATYRARAEVDAWREKEPLKRAQEKLLAQGLEAAVLDSMDEVIRERLGGLQTWALAQAFPTLEQAQEHVWIPLQEGAATCQ